MTAPEPLVSITVLAEHLGTPVETIRHWRKHGRGPRGYKLGGRVLFRLSEVEAWLQTQREDGPAVRALPAYRRANRSA